MAEASEHEAPKAPPPRRKSARAHVRFSADTVADASAAAAAPAHLSERAAGASVDALGRRSAAGGAGTEELCVELGLLKQGRIYEALVPAPEVGADHAQVRLAAPPPDEDGRDGGVAVAAAPGACEWGPAGRPLLTVRVAAASEGPVQWSGSFTLEARGEGPCRSLVMPVEVRATVMGRDRGTPQLRHGVHCVGKIVQYDSDTETQWQ